MRSEKVLFKAPYTEKGHKIIRKELKGLVLDVGCGDGLLSLTHTEILLDLTIWKNFT